MLMITIEINPPHEGSNRLVGGVFVSDDDGQIYIAHTGRIGGGRSGNGMTRFREFLGETTFAEISSSQGTRSATLLGPIDSDAFPSQLAAFVHKAAEFKSSSAK
jgi:hypothetical protein